MREQLEKAIDTTIGNGDGELTVIDGFFLVYKIMSLVFVKR